MVDADKLMADWPALRTAHRNAEFYLIPFTGRGILITHDETTEPVKPRGEDHDDEENTGREHVPSIAPARRQDPCSAG